MSARKNDFPFVEERRRRTRRQRDRFVSGSVSSDSSSASTSPARSTISAPDGLRKSTMKLTGKAPSTPATPILKVTRQSSYVTEKIVVGVRLRPFIAEDCQNGDGEAKTSAVTIETQGAAAVVQVQSKTGPMIFEFDHGFKSDNGDGSDYDVDQRTVYEKLTEPLVDAFIAGFNCSFFAYGQTGTGKTFSTHGGKETPGVVPRFCRHFLDAMDAKDSWKLEVSYFEIYNETIIDLLVSKGHQRKLRVREHPEEGPFVENLTSVRISKYGDVEKWLELGNNARRTVATTRNDGSSRSHAVFLLKLVQMMAVGSRPVLRVSKASFVDLAGSERLDATSSSMSCADRMTETKNINKSLACLANVILQLADGKRKHISYRDSVLTWLLKDSLGGNAKTVMLATVAPSLAYVDETLSTLRYAAKAYKIYNKAYVNEDPAIGYIEQLKEENERLKAMLSVGSYLVSNDSEIQALKAKIEELSLALEQRDLEISRISEERDEALRQLDNERMQQADMLVQLREEYKAIFLSEIERARNLSLKLEDLTGKSNSFREQVDSSDV